MLHFIEENAMALQQKIIEHVWLTSLALLLASLLAIPSGILIVRTPSLRYIILKAGSISQTIPSLAMLAFLVPFLGLGATPTLAVLTFYAIYPILRGTYTGLKSVPAECVEAARGLGFSKFQRLRIVELPLALPVIISGLRVAAAMTIGITTIAAFIGAGGLGDFILQGLSLNDSSLILLGAIPTAFLAVVFDYLISQIEKRLQNRKTKPHQRTKFQILLWVAIGFIGVLVVAPLLLKGFSDKKHDYIVIASKNFTEQYLLAEMMAQLIEAKTSLKVIRKFNLGTTNILHNALLRDEVDLYPEYSGTAYLTILKRPPTNKNILEDVRSSYQKEFNLVWLEPFGFSNSQSLAISAEYAQNQQIYSLSDLVQVSSTLNLVAPPEFLKRADAFPGLQSVYHLHFKTVKQVDPNLMYLAVANKKADVIAAFTTDGRLQEYKWVTLIDDKKFYPLYEAVPVIRKSTLEAHPQIYQALMPLFGLLTPERMRSLNYDVDVKGKSPSETVRQFIKSMRLI